MNTIQEEWRAVPNYDGYYEVSNLGRVKSVDRYIGHNRGGLRFFYGKILRPTVFGGRYRFVSLSKGGLIKKQKVSRLVAGAFIDNPKGQLIVNHIDGDKTNDLAENLEWCSHKENLNHAIVRGLIKGKLTDNEVVDIISLKGRATGKEVGRMFSVSHQTIYSIWNHQWRTTITNKHK